jgi:L-lactate dehydrogenase
MGINNRRVVLIGTGMVGMSFAYSALNQGAPIDELILIDRDIERAKGEAQDLNHGLAFAPKKMKIWAGTYDDCAKADVIVIAAGASQLPGETRLDLIQKNDVIFEQIVKSVMKTGFDGIFVVATNPVDIMTYLTWKHSGLPQNRVIGSGTTLDTARLRYLIGQHINVDPRSIHAYVMGEHGDSEFVPWSHAFVSVKPLKDALKTLEIDESILDDIYVNVRDAAYQIIKRKKATYYGIGMSLTRIINAIFNDENSVLTVSSFLNGEYGHDGIFIGVPTIVNRKGAKKVVEIVLTTTEKELFENSVNVLKKAMPN